MNEQKQEIKWVCACLGPKDCTREDCQIRKDYLAKTKETD